MSADRTTVLAAIIAYILNLVATVTWDGLKFYWAGRRRGCGPIQPRLPRTLPLRTIGLRVSMLLAISMIATNITYEPKAIVVTEKATQAGLTASNETQAASPRAKVRQIVADHKPPQSPFHSARPNAAHSIGCLQPCTNVTVAVTSPPALHELPLLPMKEDWPPFAVPLVHRPAMSSASVFAPFPFRPINPKQPDRTKWKSRPTLSDRPTDDRIYATAAALNVDGFPGLRITISNGTTNDEWIPAVLLHCAGLAADRNEAIHMLAVQHGPNETIPDFGPIYVSIASLGATSEVDLDSYYVPAGTVRSVTLEFVQIGQGGQYLIPFNLFGLTFDVSIRTGFGELVGCGSATV